MSTCGRMSCLFFFGYQYSNLCLGGPVSLSGQSHPDRGVTGAAGDRRVCGRAAGDPQNAGGENSQGHTRAGDLPEDGSRQWTARQGGGEGAEAHVIGPGGGGRARQPCRRGR